MARDRTPAETDRLSPVQAAVFAACVAHATQSFAPIAPQLWWRAGEPFRGHRSTFAAHLRALERAGLLARRGGIAAEYDFTSAGRALAASLPAGTDAPSTARSRPRGQ